MNNLIFGLLDTSAEFPDARSARRARDLTIAWTRFKYTGRIIEDPSIDTLLRKAAATAADFCLVQAHGVLLAEVWRPDNGAAADIGLAIDRWARSGEFLAAGIIDPPPDSRAPSFAGCMLVDLARYRALGCPFFGNSVASENKPPGWNFIRLSKAGGLDLKEIPRGVAANLVHLDPGKPEQWTANDPDRAAASPQSADPAAGSSEKFLAGIRRLSANLPQAIFVWNLESYTDIEQPSDHFHPPLTALYTVSAGFKPNRILQTHGFTPKTRMVVYDYSAQGLAYRRMLHQDWDGVDYPSFLRRLFRSIPSSRAHYLLWEGMTPENLDWNLVQHRWDQELEAWGGPGVLKDHWRQFRKLDIEYLLCNILTDNDLLIEKIENGGNALIWWSNAFFSVYSNWRFSGAERREMYRSWIEKLAAKAPRLLLYGSDCNNVSVNFYPAAAYGEWLRQSMATGEDVLHPSRMNRYELRY